MSYLKIKEQDETKVLQLLKENGIDVDCYLTSWHLLARDEAEYRLSDIESQYSIINDHNKREQIINKICETLMNFNFIDEDYISDIVDEAIKIFLPDYFIK